MSENKNAMKGGKITVEDEKKRMETDQLRDDAVKETGQIVLDKNGEGRQIHLLNIIGEIEGHDLLPPTVKSTKYEHVLPKLAEIEDDEKIKGVLIMIHSCGGDVEAGLAIAEMIASLSKPTVSLVLGGSHSISVPLSVAADYSFIVPSGTIIIHPVRMNGTVIGAPPTYEYFKLIQDRIVDFIVSHSSTGKERIEEMMIARGILTKDLGTILVGEEAVKEGIINEIGGMKEAMEHLKGMINEGNKSL